MSIYSLVDDEVWKPVWGFPGYEISNYGRCVSHCGNTKFVGAKTKEGYVQAFIRRPDGLEESHPLSYYNKLSEGKKDKVGMVRVCMPMHKLVMWHFNYLDDNTEQIGITNDEWLSMPERAKTIIRQSLEINHIDHDGHNNRLDNLEYVTKVENAQAYRESEKYANYLRSVS